MAAMQSLYPTLPMDRLNTVVSFATSIRALVENTDIAKTTDIQLPDFPQHTIEDIAHVIAAVPSMEAQRLVQAAYPYKFMVCPS